MRSTNLFSLLALSVPVLATKPRVSVGELVDVRVPVGKDVQVSQESNASIIARQDIFGGFNLFARDCDPGRCKFGKPTVPSWFPFMLFSQLTVKQISAPMADVVKPLKTALETDVATSQK